MSEIPEDIMQAAKQVADSMDDCVKNFDWDEIQLVVAKALHAERKSHVEGRDRLREALKAIIREDDTGPMAYELREDGPSRAIGGTEGRFAAIARAALDPVGAS